MKITWQLSSSLMLLALLLLTIVSSSLAQAGDEHEDSSAVQGNKPKLFKLLNFKRFKTIFNKRYSSMVEEMSRMRIYLAKCFKAYVSVINYKLRKSTSYLSINYMSDWTKEEWRRTLMRPKEFAAKKKLGQRDETEKEEEEEEEEEEKDDNGVSVSVESIKQAAEQEAPGIANEKDVERKMIELATELKGHEKDPSLREIARSNGSSRRKRDLDVARDGRDVADLFGGVLAQIDRFESGQSEPVARAVDSDELYVDQAAPMGSNDGSAAPPIKRNSAHHQHQHQHQHADNDGQILYVDHRDCFQDVVQQLGCGACYVFATISVLEWHYCKSTGKRVKFSEQYPLDCGAYTCGGGWAADIIDFSLNYGVDREENFPYLARARKCTFGKPIKNEDIAGYWRITGLTHRYIPLEEFENEIDKGPILFASNTNDELSSYGGGIDEMTGCNVDGDEAHQMVLVGHGRENGIDFWLIRNSWSVTWGENGYYRMSKEALKRCYYDDELSTVMVETDNLKFRRNRRYDMERMEKLREQWLETEKKRKS